MDVNKDSGHCKEIASFGFKDSCIVSCLPCPHALGMNKNVLDKLTGTLAADEVGRPLVLHHGTFELFTEFNLTRDIGFHFGSADQARVRQYDKVREDKIKSPGEWRIMKVALAVKNVLFYPDDPKNWGSWYCVSKLAKLIGPDFFERFHREVVDNPKDASRIFRSLAIEAGYDAIVYRNLYENRVGADAEWSWLVLDCRSIINLPSSFTGKVVDAPVGARPGLTLPRRTADIEGARRKNGSVKFVKARSALLDAVAAFVEESGGEIGEDHDYFRARHCSGHHDFHLGDLEGTVMLDDGRIRMRIDSHREALAGVWTDIGPVYRNDIWATYEWIPGETVTAFVERVAGEIDRLREAIRRFTGDGDEAADMEDEIDTNASPALV
jgi:hypothetical protein